MEAMLLLKGKLDVYYSSISSNENLLVLVTVAFMLLYCLPWIICYKL